MRAAFFPPVRDHAELRKREGQESSHGVERDQLVRNAAEYNKQEAGEQCKNDDAVRIDEPATTVPEGVRQIIVLRDGAAEAREIGERGVRGKRENDEDRGDCEVIKNAFAENSGDQHRENALVTGLA